MGSEQPIRCALETAHKQIVPILNFQHTSVAEIQQRVGKGLLFNTDMTLRSHYELQHCMAQWVVLTQRSGVELGWGQRTMKK